MPDGAHTDSSFGVSIAVSMAVSMARGQKGITDMARLVVAVVVVAMTLLTPMIALAQGGADCTFPGRGHGVGGTPGHDGSPGTFPGGGNGPCNGHGNGGTRGGSGGGLAGGGGSLGGGGTVGGGSGGGTISATASEPVMLLTLAAGLLLAGALRRR